MVRPLPALASLRYAGTWALPRLAVASAALFARGSQVTAPPTHAASAPATLEVIAPAPATTTFTASTAFAAAPAEAPPTPSEPPAPAFEPTWSTGPEIGTGVAMKDTQNALGNNAFVGYAGYDVSLDDAEAWVEALYGAWLREHGVRYVWAVRGPDDSHYENKEIGNTKIGARLRAVAPSASFILVAAHSSGSCVAHELFKQLAEGKDPEGTTAGKVVYFNLDGIEKGLTHASVARLRRAYFVGAVDRVTKTASPNESEMRRTAELYAKAAPVTYVEHDAQAAGCNKGASWCVHVSLVTNAPHDPRAARGHADYTDFVGAGVATGFFQEKAEEAGLVLR